MIPLMNFEIQIKIEILVDHDLFINCYFVHGKEIYVFKVNWLYSDWYVVNDMLLLLIL